MHFRIQRIKEQAKNMNQMVEASGEGVVHYPPFSWREQEAELCDGQVEPPRMPPSCVS